MKIFPNNGNLNDAEMYFNQRLQKIRSLIERVIGILKMRFRCLLDSERRIRYSETKVGLFVYACATLHNFLISNRFDVLHGINVNIVENPPLIAVAQQIPNQPAGFIRRNELVQYLQRQRELIRNR